MSERPTTAGNGAPAEAIEPIPEQHTPADDPRRGTSRLGQRRHRVEGPHNNGRLRRRRASA